MIGRMKRLLLVLAAVLSGLSAAAQGPYRKFDTENSGLSCNNIRCVLQDSRGYVWIGTELGLNRYDGTRMKNYWAENYRLSSNYILHLFEDSRGNIWIATTKGAACYDWRTDAFFVPQDAEGHSPDGFIGSFAVDSKGTVWFFPDNGGKVYSYDAGQALLQESPFPAEDGHARYIAFDRNDRMFCIIGDELGIFSPENGAWEVLYRNPRSGLPVHRLRGPLVSRRSNDILYFTNERGLYEFQVKARRERLLLDWSGSRYPVSMVQDGDGVLSISTSRGVIRFDTGSEKVLDTFLDGLCLASCPAGNESLWIGTADAGVDLVSPAPSAFTNVSFLSDGTPVSSRITSFSQDPGGIVWMTTKTDGLLRYDPVSGNLGRVRTPGIPEELTAGCMRGNRLLLGSVKGLYEMDTASGQVRKTWPGPVAALLVTHAAETVIRSGEGFLNLDTGRPLGLPSSPATPCEDADGVFWTATYAAGVWSYNPADSTVRQYLYSRESAYKGVREMVSSVLVDQADRVWAVGHDATLCRLGTAGDEDDLYDIERVPGFPRASFLGALQDRDGIFWIATTSGLVRFDSANGSAIVYDKRHGLTVDEFTGPSCLLASGEFLFADAGGFVRFRPEALSPSLTRTDIVGFVIGDTPQVMETNINDMQELSIPFAKNSFGFSLAFPGNLSAGSVQYCLEGYDKAPRRTGPENNIYYYSVPPGTYTLRIEGHDDIRIRIIPPFWSSPAGIALIVALSLLGSGAVVFWQVRKREIRRKKEEQEKRIQEKLGFLSGFVALEQFDADSARAEFMKRLDGAVTRHLGDERFSVEALAGEMSVSVATLRRHTVAAFGTAPADYIKTKRLAVAKHLLEQGELSVSDIAFRCGFSSPSYFAKCFKDEYGTTPSSVQKTA